MSAIRVTDRATGETVAEFPDRPAVDPDAQVQPAGHGVVEVVVDGWRFVFLVEDARRADLRARATRIGRATGHDGPTEVRAIIPGRVASVAVVAGEVVSAGQRLLALEAMKMENEVNAPRAGTVQRVAAAAGATVELGDVLVVIT